MAGTVGAQHVHFEVGFPVCVEPIIEPAGDQSREFVTIKLSASQFRPDRSESAEFDARTRVGIPMSRSPNIRGVLANSDEMDSASIKISCPTA